MDINGENLSTGINYLVNTPIKAFLDIGGHYITGLFLTQRYFSESSKKKKVLLSYLSGLGPDLDYFMPFVPHKTATHSLWWAGLFGMSASSCNLEDYARIGKINTIFEGTKDNIKRIITSRYAKIASIGATFHLFSDSLSPYGYEAKTGYFLMASGLLYLQNQENKRKKSLEDLTFPIDVDTDIKL